MDQSPIVINAVVHALTGAQLLYYLNHIWDTAPAQTCVVWCYKGDGAAKANAIRVALAKDRKVKTNGFREFELRFSDPFAYTLNEVKGEAIVIRRVSGSTTTRLMSGFIRMGLVK